MPGSGGRHGLRRPAGGLCPSPPADGPPPTATGSSTKGLAELAEDPAPPGCPVRPRGESPPGRCAAPPHHRQPTPRAGGAGGSAHRPPDGIGEGRPGPAGYARAPKAGRNRAIREKGRGLFVTLLAYKEAARGGQGIRVPAAYSSLEGPRPVPVLLPGTRVRDDGGGEGGGDDGRSGASCLGTLCAPIPSDACHPPGPPDEAGTAPPLGGILRLEPWGGCQHVGRRRARGLCRPRSLGSKGMAGP